MGFAGPHGRWDPSLDDTLEDLGYLYSSDFQLGYDDFPFYPWKGDRFSRVLQIPVHPVCEGLFLEAGVDDPGVIGDYFAGIVAVQARRGRAGRRLRPPRAPARPDARGPDDARPGDRQASPWSGARRSRSWRGGGAGGPSEGGWSSRARIIAWRSSSTSGTPNTTWRWRSTAGGSVARCP